MLDAMRTAPPDEVRVRLVKYLHDTATTCPLLALSHTAQLHEVIHDARALAIVMARLEGHSWRRIAAALEEPQATVNRKYACLDPVDQAHAASIVRLIRTR